LEARLNWVVDSLLALCFENFCNAHTHDRSSQILMTKQISPWKAQNPLQDMSLSAKEK
jgi:hypothetical protein